jgi:uncharacterized protein
MINRIEYLFPLLILISITVYFAGCGKSGEEKNKLDKGYVSALLQERASNDSAMQYESYSPFVRDENAHFSPLKYFEPTAEFIFKSKLYEYNPKDTVDVYGTRGELRRVIKVGYVVLTHNGNEYKVNVYKGFTKDGQSYYSIWFTDNTTGKETYGVGRYLDFEKEADPDHIYTIDFNRAYNPYCAYSSLYTCPIPRKEDHLDMSITAGEKNFHE